MYSQLKNSSPPPCVEGLLGSQPVFSPEVASATSMILCCAGARSLTLHCWVSCVLLKTAQLFGP